VKTAPNSSTFGHQRIAMAFERAAAEGRTPLVLYLTAGDPNAEASFEIVLAAIDAGADIIELGVPWSDPSADGLAIQGGMSRALDNGGGLSATLLLTKRLREARPDTPIILFGYANPIVVRGCHRYAEEARLAGADGTLCVDWPADEDQELPSALAEQGLAFVPLLAPTSTPERVEAALRSASGFVYYVSLTGITGAALTDLSKPEAHVTDIRSRARAAENELPIVVGFGIKDTDSARRVAGFADGVVVGSAAVRIVARAHETGGDARPDLRAFVGHLKTGLTNSR